MRNAGMTNVPVIVGGIIPPDDELVLKQMGVLPYIRLGFPKITEISGRRREAFPEKSIQRDAA